MCQCTHEIKIKEFVLKLGDTELKFSYISRIIFEWNAYFPYHKQFADLFLQIR